MINLLLKLNDLKTVDVVFFIVCAALIGIAVGVYFLIPVFNKKQYQEQRDNLRKREQAFKSNIALHQPDATDENQEQPQQEQTNE